MSVLALRRQLDAVDWEGLRQELREVLASRTGPGLPVARDVAGPLREVLTRRLGDWYARGPQVGDESVTGWCWCHCALRGWDPARRDASLDAVVDGLLLEAQACRSWRVALLDAIDTTDPWELDDQAGLTAAILVVVEALLGLGIHDAWYPNLVPAVRWLAEARGQAVDDALEARLEALTGTRFTSWTTPSVADRRAFAEQAAWALLEAELDLRYPR